MFHLQHITARMIKMKKQMLHKLTALLLAVFMLFSLTLTGCTDAEIEAAADIALSVLEAMEDESSAASSQITSSESSESSSVSSQPASLPPSSISSSAPARPSSEITVSSSTAPAEPENETVPAEDSQLAPPAIEEDEWYSSKDEVALYIHTYGKLPGNFLTKKQAGNGTELKKMNIPSFEKVTTTKIRVVMQKGTFAGLGVLEWEAY